MATDTPTAADVPVTVAMLTHVRDELASRIDQVRAEARADTHRLEAKLDRVLFLVEEQNARNKVVLDGITTLLARQNQVEQRVTVVEDTVRQLARPVP